MWAASGTCAASCLAKILFFSSTAASAKRRPAGVRADVAFGEVGEAQHLQRLGDREELVDLELQVRGQGRQVGPAGIGLGRDRLGEAGQEVGGDAGQR